MREREVLWFLAHGDSNADIAAALGIAEDTVRRHMTVILRKLSVKNRVQAALYAIRSGIAPLFPSAR